MSNIKIVTVATRDEFRTTIAQHAARGFLTLRDEGSRVTLSKKKTFNWLLAIICLFIPIIGWIALAVMLMASGRGSEVVEISLEPTSA